MTIKQEIKNLIQKAINDNVLEFSVETSVHADYASNVALILAKKQNKNPMEVAEKIKSKINSDMLERVETASPGFINFFVSKKYLQGQLKVVLKEKSKFGNLKNGKNEKVNVEFISANPTGPLTLGNGRGGFGGDVLSNVLMKAGRRVSREYYINNVGNQITKLGHSVVGDQEAVYKGNYIDELRGKVKGKSIEEIGQKSAKIILEEMIKPSVKKMGIKFDTWFSEEDLYKNKEVDKIIADLKEKGFTYELEGALWFKSTDFGDDKDRVLVRADGVKTYFASDIAYLKNKFKRGFSKLIIFLGADHYGYVARLKAACRALGYDQNNITVVILQLAKLFENGKEVRMSKRAGTYVTIDELIDEVGLDAARFFFLQRSLNTHFNFDMNLAKEKSDKNPVFKVQYACARINSIFTKTKIKSNAKNLDLLKNASELNLMKQLIRLPEIVEDTAKDCQLQRLANYVLDLADAFHKFYENCRVITEDKNLTEARLLLLMAVKIVLENTLELIGASAPKEMKRDEIK